MKNEEIYNKYKSIKLDNTSLFFFVVVVVKSHHCLVVKQKNATIKKYEKNKEKN
jgi:hypothetical protein